MRAFLLHVVLCFFTPDITVSLLFVIVFKYLAKVVCVLAVFNRILWRVECFQVRRF